MLVQRNRLYHGPHDVLVLLGAYGIAQDNILDGSYQDAYGAGAGGRPGALVGSNNVYQRNIFLNAGESSDAGTNCFTKFEGTTNIGRFNVFAYGNQEGVATEAGDWSPIAYDNRLYNNTFYRMGAGAWRVLWYDSGEKIGYNKFVNNVVVDSRMSPAKPSFNNDITIAVKGFNGTDLEGNEILSNMFSPHGGAAPVILVYEGPGDIDLKTAESMFPRHFKGNVWKRPIFVSTNPRALRDFDLKPESPGIDAGAFVTTVVGSGKSDRMQVVDAKFFIDGFGLVPGDVIRLQGTSTTARIVGVEHSTNTLRLAEAVSFTAGQGVALNYSGAAPDMGGREYASAAPAPAPAPAPGADPGTGADAGAAPPRRQPRPPTVSALEVVR